VAAARGWAPPVSVRHNCGRRGLARQELSYQVRCGAANGGKRAENGYCCQIGSAAANGNILKISPETAQV